MRAVEKKIDTLLETVKELTVEMGTLKSEMHHRIDDAHERLDSLELKIDNLASENRGNLKQLEKRSNIHENIMGKLSYESIANESKIARVREGSNKK